MEEGIYKEKVHFAILMRNEKKSFLFFILCVPQIKIYFHFVHFPQRANEMNVKVGIS